VSKSSREEVIQQYRDKVTAILLELGVGQEIISISPWDISFDYFDKSPRINSTSLAEVGFTSQPASLPSCLNETKRKNLNPIARWYLKQTEPLFNDRLYIYLCNQEDDCKKMISGEKNADTKEALQARLQKLQEKRADYTSFMNEYRVQLLEAERDAYIDELSGKYLDLRSTLSKIKAISRDVKSGQPGSLESRDDCLENYGLHQNYIEKISPQLTEEEQTKLSLLCNHHNDAAYQQPKLFTKLEIFYSRFKCASAILGVLLVITGVVLEGVSFGIGTPVAAPLIVAGVGLIAGPSVIERVGHSIHSIFFRRRAPDTSKLKMMAASLVTGVIGMVTLGLAPLVSTAMSVTAYPVVYTHLAQMAVSVTTIVPLGVMRQLVTPRQGWKALFRNMIELGSYSKTLNQRKKTNERYASLGASTVTPQNPSINSDDGRRSVVVSAHDPVFTTPTVVGFLARAVRAQLPVQAVTTQNKVFSFLYRHRPTRQPFFAKTSESVRNNGRETEAADPKKNAGFCKKA